MDGQFYPLQPIQFLDGVLGVAPRSPTVAGLSLSFYGSADSQTNSVTVPAGIQGGDLAILFDVTRSTGSMPADVVPSGFTGIEEINVLGTNGVRARVAYKILDGSETTIVGMSGDNSHDKILLLFRGTTPITAAAPQSPWNEVQTASNPSAQTVLASAQPTPLVVLGLTFNFNGTAFSTASPAFDGTVSTAGNRLVTGYKIYNASPTNHSIDMNDLGNANFLMSGYMAVS